MTENLLPCELSMEKWNKMMNMNEFISSCSFFWTEVPLLKLSLCSSSLDWHWVTGKVNTFGIFCLLLIKHSIQSVPFKMSIFDNNVLIDDERSSSFNFKQTRETRMWKSEQISLSFLSICYCCNSSKLKTHSRVINYSLKVVQ